MTALTSFPNDRDRSKLVSALHCVERANVHRYVEVRIVNNHGEIVASNTAGPPTEHGIVFFSERGRHPRSYLVATTRLRLWDRLLKRAPIFLDNIRQVVNKLVPYKAPRLSSSSYFKVYAPISTVNTISGKPIAIIGMNWLDVGGAENFAIASAKLASSMGFRVIVICDKVGPLTWLEKLGESAELIYMLGGLEESIRRSVCSQLILQLTPNFIHIHHCLTIYKLLPALRQSSLKSLVLDSSHVVENRHGGFIAESQQYSPWIDFHHVISKSLKQLYLDAGIPSDRIHLGYLGQKQEFLQKSARAVSSQPLRVGFIGRLVQQKRPYLFVELAKRLSREAPGAFSFEMIGDGLLAESIKEQMHRMQAPVILYPSQFNIQDFLLRMDILVICSDQEGLTLVAFEAIIHDCMVISSDVGAQHELVDPPALLPVAPYQFLRASTALLLKIRSGEIEFCRIKQQQRQRYLHILSQPNAIEICSDIYRKSLSLKCHYNSPHDSVT